MLQGRIVRHGGTRREQIQGRSGDSDRSRRLQKTPPRAEIGSEAFRRSSPRRGRGIAVEPCAEGDSLHHVRIDGGLADPGTEATIATAMPLSGPTRLA